MDIFEKEQSCLNRNMQNNKPLKIIADELMQIKGRTKGSELVSFAAYIQEKKGKSGLKAIEKKMAEIGCPFHFDEVKELGKWYPESVNVLAILVAKYLFNWSEEDVFNFGYDSTKYSFLLKILIKYFASFRMVFERAPKYWRKFVDVGELEAAEFNEEKKYSILRLRNYLFHPIMCDYFAGFFLKITENSIKSPRVKIEETKCLYRGDSYHEYIIRWE